jgi:hypothetical protein
MLDERFRKGKVNSAKVYKPVTFNNFDSLWLKTIREIRVGRQAIRTHRPYSISHPPSTGVIEVAEGKYQIVQ